MGYKMKHTGVPALLKALVGDQHKLPENLKKAIEASPAQSKGGNGGNEKTKEKETPGQKKYREAMERIAAQTAASAKRKKEGPKKGIRIKMGMGTSFKETRIGGSPNKMYGKKK